MAKVLALSRAGIENAKTFYRWRLFFHICTLCIGVAGIFVPDNATYLLAVFALITEGIAWILNYMGDQSHTLSRQGLRRAILLDAFGVSDATLDIANFKRRFSKAVETKAEYMDMSTYYGSVLPFGIERFREDLQESAFWSSHLFGKAAINSLIKFIVFVVASFAIIFFTAPYISGANSSLFFRVIILFLSFVPASEEFRNLFAWWDASKQTGSVRDRLEHVDLEAKEQLLTAFGDYIAAVETAPPIPTSLHKKDQERLNRLWQEFKNPQH